MNRSKTHSTRPAHTSNPDLAESVALNIAIQGAVQGVGFRPFVYRLAHELELSGWVVNDSRGVEVEIEGPRPVVEEFRRRLESDAPPRACILRIDQKSIHPAGGDRFEIRQSADQGAKTVVMLPEVATCEDCRREISDTENRRHRYPFTNCTNCGPRFTIIEDLPYDRDKTTMRSFEMCPRCRREYEDPNDRRYHAQPNACPTCGPQIALWDRAGRTMHRGTEALEGAAQAIRNGKIVAVKGLGGFHLLVDARSGPAVEVLRRRKGRYEKPLALMVPDPVRATELCTVTAHEREALSSPEAPIVLLERRSDARISDAVAPDNPRLGVMLPYTPLHHLLLEELDFPVVATSGNLSDEPICIDNHEAMERLAAIADLFLVHDRPIRRHCDDSVVMRVGDHIQPIRRARGLAPMPLLLDQPVPEILAVGGHLKNVVALSKADRVFLSQHIGDMETLEARRAFEAVVRDFIRIYESRPVAVAHDLHPDYPTTMWARDRGAEIVDESERGDGALIPVQHHHAHLVSCLVDQGRSEPCLGVIWDGTGYGSDGTVWGGEFLFGNADGFARRARWRRFSLPGGEAAIREPRRSALAVLWEIWGEAVLEGSGCPPACALEPAERPLLARMLSQGINSPRTSSVGRLFDAVASLVGLKQTVAFEGQAAMMLEFAVDASERSTYPFELVSVPPAERDDPERELLEIDWEPMVRGILEDCEQGTAIGIIAARFHQTLVETIAAIAEQIGEPTIALSGGCFQNRWLTERTLERLRGQGFDVLCHRRVPCNDGGISLGQIAVAAARRERSAG